LNASRRRRIAAGSGTEVQDVNRLIKQFREMQKLMKMVQKTGGRGLSRLFG
jgi:signal recognition particle subunit SRP54